MSELHTVIIASTDKDAVSAAEEALTHANEYRLIVCRSAKDAQKRLDEVDTRLVICDAVNRR